MESDNTHPTLRVGVERQPMTFDFDKAYAAFAGNTAVQQWMTLNKPQLVALTVDQILALVAAYATGADSAAAITSALSLDAQAAAMVTGSADVARRQYEAGQRLQSLGRLGLQLLVAVLAAGVAL